MIYAAVGGLVLLLVLLLVFVILKSKKKKKLAFEYNALLEESFNPVTMMQNEPAGVDIMNIKTEKSMELRKIIRQFAEDNPEIAAYMLRTLLRGGEEQDV
jgi:flagellar M-ring protein FliF